MSFFFLFFFFFPGNFAPRPGEQEKIRYEVYTGLFLGKKVQKVVIFWRKNFTKIDIIQTMMSSAIKRGLWKMYYFLVQTSSQIWFIPLVDDCQFPIPPRKIGNGNGKKKKKNPTWQNLGEQKKSKKKKKKKKTLVLWMAIFHTNKKSS